MKNLVFVFAILAIPALSQDLKKSATDHFNNKEWAAAVKDFLKLTKVDQADSSDWYNLAFSQMKLEN